MSDAAGRSFARLVQIMRTLRAPGGCPWDREQTLQSLRPFVLEETYELLEAIDRDDGAAVCEELGDYLYEAVFLAQIAEEAGRFSIADSIGAIADKLVRRHPHVFDAGGAPLATRGEITTEQVVRKWEDLKAGERGSPGQERKTLLGGVPRSLPSLLRAHEMSTRAAAVGFDWTRAADVLDKIEEEVAELREAVERDGASSARAEEELGDVFFAIANLARKLGIEPEAALRRANEKFQARFDEMERRVRDAGRKLSDLSLDEMERHWQAVKDGR